MSMGWFRSGLVSSGIVFSNRGLDVSVQSGDCTHFNFFLGEHTQGFFHRRRYRRRSGYRLFVSRISSPGRHDDNGTNISNDDSSAASVMASMIYGVRKIGCASDFGFVDGGGNFRRGLVPDVATRLRCVAPSRRVARWLVTGLPKSRSSGLP